MRTAAFVLAGLVGIIGLSASSFDQAPVQRVSAQQPDDNKALLDQLNKLQQKIEGISKRADALQTKDPPAQPKADPPKKDPKPRSAFKTGARRTPLHRVMQGILSGRVGIHRHNGKVASTVAMVPKTLSMLGNDQYGDCVSAESGFSIEGYSVYVGLPEIVIPDQSVIDFAQAHGDLNGADLLSVIQDMEKDGMKDSTGTVRKAGSPSTVDYTNEQTLQSAIAVGPVSIAIGSGDLPSGAGNQNGWFALTSNGAANDHCVSLCGYGTAEDLFKALGVALPPECAGKTGYLLYTWSTIGFVTHAWITGTTQEAWVRTPTVVGLTPVPPVPPVPPDPTPPVPPIPPTPPSVPTLVLPVDLPAGSYYLVPQASGNLRVIDLLLSQQPTPTLTPEERQVLQNLINRLQKQKR